MSKRRKRDEPHAPDLSEADSEAQLSPGSSPDDIVVDGSADESYDCHAAVSSTADETPARSWKPGEDVCQYGAKAIAGLAEMLVAHAWRTLNKLP